MLLPTVASPNQFRVLLCASSLATEAEAVLATKQEYFAERSLGR